MLQIDVLQQPSHYELLQVSPLAEQVEIKSAYRRLSRLYHPDSRSLRTDQRVQQQLNAAWEVLGDPLSRAQYDRQQALHRPAFRARRGAGPAQPQHETDQARRAQAERSRQEAERRRAEAEHLEREEAERIARAELARQAFRQQREAEARARLERTQDRTQRRRILREQQVRRAAPAEHDASASANGSREAAWGRAQQIAAEQAREQLRERRYRLIIAPDQQLK